jgi:uroporphyrinogen-III synthase
MKLLITRHAHNAERSAAALRARGHDVLVAPLMTIEQVTADLAGAWGGVIITSANAPDAIAHNPLRGALVKLPLFAVGRRSAEAARAAGFANVTSADGDMGALTQLVATRRPVASAPLLYLAGENRAGDLSADLARHGVTVTTAVVYRAVTASFPAPLVGALAAGGINGVLHFSVRSADNYIAGARAAGLLAAALAPRQFCLSQQIAEPLAGAGAGDIAVAARPDEAALLDLAGPA